MTLETLRVNPVSAEINHNFNLRKQRSNTGYYTQIDFGGGYWSLKISLPSFDYSKYYKLFSFLNKQNRFKLIISKISNSRSSFNGTIQVDGASQTGSVINITSSGKLNTCILKAGDFITFENSEKVYQVTDDCITDGAGDAVMNISPSLIKSPANLENIKFRDVEFTVVSTSSQTLSINQFYRGTLNLELEEAFLS